MLAKLLTLPFLLLSDVESWILRPLFNSKKILLGQFKKHETTEKKLGKFINLIRCFWFSAGLIVAVLVSKIHVSWN